MSVGKKCMPRSKSAKPEYADSIGFHDAKPTGSPTPTSPLEVSEQGLCSLLQDLVVEPGGPAANRPTIELEPPLAVQGAVPTKEHELVSMPKWAAVPDGVDVQAQNGERRD